MMKKERNNSNSIDLYTKGKRGKKKTRERAREKIYLLKKKKSEMDIKKREEKNAERNL